MIVPLILKPSRTMRTWIHDASNLVCKRRKAPHTSLDAWRGIKITYFQQNLMEPVIPCMFVNYLLLSHDHLSFCSIKSSVSLQTFLQNTKLSSTKCCLNIRHKRSLQDPLLLVWSIYNMKHPINLQSPKIHTRGILLLTLHHMIHTRGILLLTPHQQIILRSPLLIDQKWECKSHLPWRLQLLL